MKYYKLQGEGQQFEGNVLVDPTAQVHKGAKVGPNVVIGAGCVIEEGARIRNSTLFKNTKVRRGAYIDGSILSWDCTVGEWARIEGLSVIAESVKVKDEIRITQAMVMSQKEISANVEKGAIVM